MATPNPLQDSEALTLVRGKIRSWEDLARKLTDRGARISGQACRKWQRIPPSRVHDVADITGLSPDAIDPYRRPRKAVTKKRANS